MRKRRAMPPIAFVRFFPIILKNKYGKNAIAKKMTHDITKIFENIFCRLFIVEIN